MLGMGNGIGKGLEVGKEIAWLRNNKDTILGNSWYSERSPKRAVCQ